MVRSICCIDEGVENGVQCVYSRANLIPERFEQLAKQLVPD